MIPRMRAVAIDDEKPHLDAISRAATRAGFGCVPLHYPNDTSSDNLKGLAFDAAHIRIIITDLHLDATAQTRDGHANYIIIASLIQQMNLPAWTPYVLVLWTQHPQESTGLTALLEARLEKSKLPGLLVELDKKDYNVLHGDVNHEKLWKDLQEKINGSRAVNVLLQWEKEIIQAADNVVRKLHEVARSAEQTGISFDNELDKILSSIAQTATSVDFASQDPRAAVNGGLLPVLIDEMEHMALTPEQTGRWTAALAQAVGKKKTPPLEKEIAILNDALHISRDGKTSGAHRGAVLDVWHNMTEFESIFGVKPKNTAPIFHLDELPHGSRIMYVQIEGLCDSVQQKKGVVPFALACEVPGAVSPKKENRPMSIEASSIYLGNDGKDRKLIVNLRYFFTSERNAAKSHKADFRLRESMINKWAFAWANHAIRPGLVEFFPPK